MVKDVRRFSARRACRIRRFNPYRSQNKLKQFTFRCQEKQTVYILIKPADMYLHRFENRIYPGTEQRDDIITKT